MDHIFLRKMWENIYDRNEINKHIAENYRDLYKNKNMNGLTRENTEQELETMQIEPSFLEEEIDLIIKQLKPNKSEITIK